MLDDTPSIINQITLEEISHLLLFIPKENEVKTMNKFRLITFLYCSYKIFYKSVTSRLGKEVLVILN
jgi:DNA-directed RNA polymerase subunit RPC12/RpoP